MEGNPHSVLEGMIVDQKRHNREHVLISHTNDYPPLSQPVQNGFQFFDWTSRFLRHLVRGQPLGLDRKTRGHLRLIRKWVDLLDRPKRSAAAGPAGISPASVPG